MKVTKTTNQLQKLQNIEGYTFKIGFDVPKSNGDGYAYEQEYVLYFTFSDDFDLHGIYLKHWVFSNNLSKGYTSIHEELADFVKTEKLFFQIQDMSVETSAMVCTHDIEKGAIEFFLGQIDPELAEKSKIKELQMQMHVFFLNERKLLVTRLYNSQTEKA